MVLFLERLYLAWRCIRDRLRVRFSDSSSFSLEYRRERIRENFFIIIIPFFFAEIEAERFGNMWSGKRECGVYFLLLFSVCLYITFLVISFYPPPFPPLSLSESPLLPLPFFKNLSPFSLHLRVSRSHLGISFSIFLAFSCLSFSLSLASFSSLSVLSMYLYSRFCLSHPPLKQFISGLNVT